ncbi:hypothetical protein [Blastococcus sp. SYSU D00820]
MSRTRRCLAVTVALLAAGCSASVDGTAQRAGTADTAPAEAGPLTEFGDRLDLSGALGKDGWVEASAVRPDGALVALVALTTSHYDDEGASLVEVLPGPEVGFVVELRPTLPSGFLFARADGSVVLAGAGEGGFAMAIVDEDGGIGDVHGADFDGEFGEFEYAASPDGGILYVGYDDGDAQGLVAIDVDSGEVLAEAPWQVPGADGIAALSAGADGSVTALFRNADGSVLATYGSDLIRSGELLDPMAGRFSVPVQLRTAPDGAQLLSLITTDDAQVSWIVVVRDGVVEQSIALSTVYETDDLAVDPAGHWLYVSTSQENGSPWLTTVDLRTGDVLGDVGICAEHGYSTGLGLAADGSSLTVVAGCSGANGAGHVEAVAVG